MEPSVSDDSRRVRLLIHAQEAIAEARVRFHQQLAAVLRGDATKAKELGAEAASFTQEAIRYTKEVLLEGT